MERDERECSDIPAPESLHYEGGFIPLDDINVLPQPRQKFLEIDIMSEDISTHLLLSPPIVVELGVPQACGYLDAINSIWGTKFTVEELRSVPREDGEERKFYILVAGERRLRACRKLDTVGCEKHRAENGGENTSCYEKHFGSRDLEVRMARDVDAWGAISIQASENIHMRVPPEDEAPFYDKLYRARVNRDPTYTVRRFAKDVGRSLDAIQAAFRFCNLPETVQGYARDGKLPYGVAVELDRARECLELDEAGIKYWTQKALAKRWKVDEFRKEVNAAIEVKNSNQTMLGLWTEAQEEEMRKSHVRRTFAKEIIQVLWAENGYFSRVLQALEDGSLGQDGSPFSIKSPLRFHRALLETLAELNPHLQELLSADELQRAREILRESQRLLPELEKIAGDLDVGPVLPD